MGRASGCALSESLDLDVVGLGCGPGCPFRLARPVLDILLGDGGMVFREGVDRSFYQTEALCRFVFRSEVALAQPSDDAGPPSRA